MFGNRGIWHDGWKAVTEHGPISGMSNFDQDTWQLFHTDVDRAEAHDLAAEHPEKLQELVALWFEEAKANNVLPLNDMQVAGKDLETFLAMEFNIPVPPSGQYTYYPGTSEVPERSAANVHGVSYKALAEVEFTPDTSGVIFAHGSRFGGHTLFVEGRPARVRLQLPRHPPRGPGQGPAPSSGHHIVGVDFTKESMDEHRVSHGTLKLFVDDEVIGQDDDFRTMTGHFSLCGEGLCIGYDSGDAASSEYAGTRFPFTGGTLTKVVFDVADDAYVDVEKHLWAAMVRD